jgi:hypothetical protein
VTNDFITLVSITSEKSFMEEIPGQLLVHFLILKPLIQNYPIMGWDSPNYSTTSYHYKLGIKALVVLR